MSFLPPKRVALRRLCFLLSAACGSLLAAEPAVLAPVLVEVLRTPQPLDRVVADVVVIDRDAIRDSGADSLEDLLRRQGGLQLTRSGGPGQPAGVLLRGASSGNTVVIIDGVRIGSATLGQTDLSVLSLAEIDRIEILRGPGSSLYGADAVGGVVSIVTRRGRGAPIVTAHLAAGGLGSRQAEAAVTASKGAFDIAASLAREQSDGVSVLRASDPFGRSNPDADGFVRESGSVRLGLAVASGHRVGLVLQRHSLKAQFDGADYPPPDFLPDPSFDFRRTDRASVASLDWRGQWSTAAATQLQFAEQRDETASIGSVTDRFDTRRRQFTLQHQWKPGNGLGEWLFAVDHVEERIAAAVAYAEDARRNTGLVIGWSLGVGSQRFQADLRRDDNSAYGAVTTGKLGWAMDLSKALTLRAVAGTAFRAPSFNDLYFPGYGRAVEPERSTSVEAGLRWRDGDRNAGVTVYRNRVSDLIGYEPSPAACGDPVVYAFGCAANVGRARLHGATLDAGHRHGAWNARIVLDFLDAKDKDTGDRLPRRAAHSGSVAIGWADGAWSAGANLLGIGARPDSGRLGAYEVLDLSLRRAVGTDWRVEAQLRNALDRDVEAVRDARSPGRQAWVGLRYDSAGF